MWSGDNHCMHMHIHIINCNVSTGFTLLHGCNELFFFLFPTGDLDSLLC